MFRQIQLVLFFTLLLLSSCGRNDANTGSRASKNTIKSLNHIVPVHPLESTVASEHPIDKIVRTYNYNTAKCDWISLDTFFPVFEFGPDTVGLTFEIHYDGVFTCIDSLFHYATYQPESTSKIGLEDEDPKFKHNAALQKKIRSTYDGKLYLYGTRGIDTVFYKEVVYALQQCGSSVIVLKIPGIDKKRVGHPLFCSRLLFPMQYGRFPDIEGPLNRVKKQDSLGYKDKTPVTVFARCDSLYFGYEDDFRWTLTNDDTICTFPSRFVMVKPKDKRKESYDIWDATLDLFGIPCD